MDLAVDRRSGAPLIVHIVYRFDYGGLENGVVNVINATHGEQIRHCIIALTEASDFRDRLHATDVEVHELRKKLGKDFGVYFRLYRLLRQLKPAVVHTRNLGTLDCAVVARLAGSRTCFHGEHGWDIHDPDGTNKKYRLMRRIVNPFVHRFITVSENLHEWLVESVGIKSRKVTRICNGVNTSRFSPANDSNIDKLLVGKLPDECVVVGSVLRFEEIKDPLNLVQAFILARQRMSECDVRIGLVMIGDGTLLAQAHALLEEADLAEYAWLPGNRDDVPEIMRCFDVFVLGSRREGISNTLLEAMACGLPVIATNTGGNTELVRPGKTGALVAPASFEELANAIMQYAHDHSMRKSQGQNARRIAVEEYSLDTMIDKYRHLYVTAIAG